MFFEDITFLDYAFDDANHYFDFIFPILKVNNFVKTSFLSAIKERELHYPTALPTRPYIVALPHTDIEHIVRPFISITRVKGKLVWYEMANNERTHNVNFIFLLGFTQKDGHIHLLQTLMESFSEKDFLEKLYDEKDKHNFIQLVTDKIKL